MLPLPRPSISRTPQESLFPNQKRPRQPHGWPAQEAPVTTPAQPGSSEEPLRSKPAPLRPPCPPVALRRCIPRCARVPFRRARFLRLAPAKSCRDRGSPCRRLLPLRPCRPRRSRFLLSRWPALRPGPGAVRAIAREPASLRHLASPTPGTPLRPQPRPNLAGQPAARPVVPPRPDMVARLQQQQTRPAPGQVQQQAPRPGMPTRSSTPVPGQPIYRGPIRPGQPVMRGPGVGGGPPGRQAADQEHFAGRALCIPRRLCAPSRPRRSHHRAAAASSSQTRRTRSPSRCGAGRGPAADAVAPRRANGRATAHRS